MNSPYLLSEPGLRRLADFCLQPALYAFDFDGTLAPIVQVPMEAQMGPSTRGWMDKLDLLAPVAVVSGRSVHDLGFLLHGFRPRYLVGNHGLEGTPSGEKMHAAAARMCSAWVGQLQQVLPERLFREGVALENKTLSLTLHYRGARGHDQVRAEIAGLLKQAETSGELQPAPRIIPGKDVFNLVPPGAPHKGNAVVELIENAGFAQALYVGDDDTDEDVFRMQDPRILGIRVGAITGSAADFYLHDLGEVDLLLSTLVSLLGKATLGAGTRVV